MKPLRILIICIAVMLGLASSVFTLSWYVRRRVYESSYSKIHVGDSEQTVVRLYGEPSEITDCSDYKRPGYIDEVRINCTKVYWYRSFLKQWVFFLDKDGKVLHKAYNVMY